MRVVVELEDDGPALEDLDFSVEIDPLDFDMLVKVGLDPETVCEADEDALDVGIEVLELLECVVLITVAFPDVTEAWGFDEVFAALEEFEVIVAEK